MDAHELSLARYQKAQDRLEKDFGGDQLDTSIRITKDNLKVLVDNYKVLLEDKSNSNSLLVILSSLPLEKLALCCLQGVLSSIRQGDDMRKTLMAVGRLVHHELWADGLEKFDPALKARVEKIARRKHGSMKYRRAATRSIAKKQGYSTDKWSNKDLVSCGQVLVDGLLIACSDTFEMVQDGEGTLMITLTDAGIDRACEIQRELLDKYRVNLPTLEKTPDWTSSTDATGMSIIRSHHKATLTAVSHAIKTGQMQPAVDALNLAQSTAWTINSFVLRTQQEAVRRRLDIGGLPMPTDIPKPSMELPWDDMSDEQRKGWKITASKTAQRNRGLVSERVLSSHDHDVAEWLSGYPAFYLQMNFDWRGRMYYVPHFNPQREDRVRSLFLFSEGVPLGKEGWYWLLIHAANCGDFGKISKRPFKERYDWACDNIDVFIAMADDPFDDGFSDHPFWWTRADKPWLFLAAAKEIADCALRSDREAFVSHIPTSWDGSCSGLQHLCAMTRAEEGALVNLTDTETPQDVYQIVANVVKERIEAEAQAGDPMAITCRNFGIDRKLVKRNVMTYSYSSKKFGMGGQQVEDLMEPLETERLLGRIKEHPFGDEKNQRKCAQYLAGHIYDAIETVVSKPAEAMGYLQKIARALAHESKVVEWVTPVGIPWSNRYYENTSTLVRLWLYDRDIYMRVAGEPSKTVDKTKAANGISPNFVHACDGSHLCLVVLGAARRDIKSLLLVHDSFGTHAAVAGDIHHIIRDEFVKMYAKHDVLSEISMHAKQHLTPANHKRLPQMIEPGSLDLNGVLNATYAFA